VTARLRRTFWVLIVIGVVSAGALSTALSSEPGPATGVAVAGSAVLLGASAFLSLRMLLAVAPHAGRKAESNEQ
jgi:hypothetical protein